MTETQGCASAQLVQWQLTNHSQELDSPALYKPTTYVTQALAR